MPGGVVLLIELFLDVGCDILLDSVLGEGCGGAVNSVLLHFVRHIGILDHGSTLFRHPVLKTEGKKKKEKKKKRTKKIGIGV